MEMMAIVLLVMLGVGEAGSLVYKGRCMGAEGTCVVKMPENYFQMCIADQMNGFPFTMDAQTEPCIKPPLSSAPSIKVKAIIYQPNAALPTASVQVCTLKCARLCRWVSGYNPMRVSEREEACLSPPSKLTLEECKTAVATGQWKGISVNERLGLNAMRSMRARQATFYGGWPGWTDKCEDIEDIVIQNDTAILSATAEKSIVSVPGHPSLSPNCTLEKEGCELESGAVTWKSSSFSKTYCPFLPAKPPVDGVLRGSFLVLPTLQEAVSFAASALSPPNCIPSDSLISEQGPAFRLIHYPGTAALQNTHLSSAAIISSPTHSNGAPAPLPNYLSQIHDPSNPKLTFLAEELSRQEAHSFALEHFNTCELKRTLHNVMLTQMMAGGATPVARYLLNRTDVAAEVHGDVFWAYPCHRARAIAYFADHKVPGEKLCRGLVPVLLESGRIMFQLPGSRDLIEGAPKVPCDSIGLAIMRESGESGFSSKQVRVLRSKVFIDEIAEMAQSSLIFNSAPAFESRSVVAPLQALHAAQENGHLSLQVEMLLEVTKASLPHPDEVQNIFDGLSELVYSSGRALSEVYRGAGEGISNAAVGLGTGVREAAKGILSPLVIVAGVLLAFALTCLLGLLLIRGLILYWRKKKAAKADSAKNNSMALA